MDDNALRELLDAHANALNQGQESLAVFLEVNPSLPPETRSLFALVWQLKQLLVPVPVPDPFKTQLRQHLTTTPDVTVAVRLPSRRRPLWMGAAAVGSLLPLLGLLLFWRRRQRTHVLTGAA